MTQYSVTTAAMQGAVSELRAATKSLDTTLNTLEAESEAHLSQWLGSAVQAYHASKAKWDSAILEMKMGCERSATNLEEIDANYTLTERQTTSAWGG